MSQTKLLGRQIDENGINPNEEKVEALLKLTEKKTRRERIPLASGGIQAKNSHCLRGLDGKYGRWDEIFRDILNSKIKIVQN